MNQILDFPDKSSKLKPIMFFLLLTIFVLSGCQPIQLEQMVDEMGVKENQPDKEFTEALPQVNIPLQAATDDKPLTASETFEQISPAVVFVETPSGSSGSGVWIEPGYIVSNAHVVWPYDAVRVVFPNGEEHADVSVIGWDLVADLAILGPLETEIVPVSFVDGSNLQVGDDIYLIGYPGETEEFPQPTLTQGILSRVRHWDAIDLAFFQVDAAVAGGQSGGVLVTGNGAVIGISTYAFTEAGFGLVASAANIVDRLETLVNDSDSESIIRRRITNGIVFKRERIRLEPKQPAQFLLMVEEETEVELMSNGAFPHGLSASAFYGYDFYESEIKRGIVTLSFTAQKEMPYLINLWEEVPIGSFFRLESNVDLIQIYDPDDKHKIQLNETYLGNLDSPDDLDRYLIDLDKGELIKVQVDSLAVDPYLTLSYENDKVAEVYVDDDSGGGPFDTNSELVFLAPEQGEYEIEVNSAYYGSEIGGYFLTVKTADSDELATKPDVVRRFEVTEHGKMEWYESIFTDAQMLFPSFWLEKYDCGDVMACYFGMGIFMVVEEELDPVAHRNIELDEYTDILIEEAEKATIGFELLKRETIELDGGVSINLLTYSTRSGRIKAIRLVYLENSKYGFNATYLTDSKFYDIEADLFKFSLDSFRLVDGE